VPDGMVFARSIKTSNIEAVVQHDGTGGATGICYSLNGAAAVYGAIAADTGITLSIPHAGGAPVDFYVWPASSATSGKLGNIKVLILNDSQLTIFDHAGLGAVLILYLKNNQLTSLSGAGIGPFTQFDIEDNLFDGRALDALYTSLPAGTGDISVIDNPGIGTHNPSIATAKGYTVTVET